MTVIKLNRAACAKCGSAIDLPHATAEECLTANARETSQLLARSRDLIAKRARLTEQSKPTRAGAARRRGKGRTA